MIYTVTFNPSLDYVVHMDQFRVGEINRAAREMIYPGGKGINVSLVLGNLHIPSKMLGFVAGFTGREIERLATVHGGDCAFILLDEGNSRINLKVSAREETAVNGLGPHISDDKLALLMKQIQLLQDGDTLVLAGSIPADVPDTIYEQILQSLEHRPIKVVVDATGDLLKNVIAYKPFLIKPNHLELGELFSVTLSTDEEVTLCARQLQAMGARNVLVSLGGDGALLLGEDHKVYRMPAPQGQLVNSVGAGDSMVAGFLAGYETSGGDLSEALKMGVCAGSASAFHEWLATEEAIQDIYQQLS
ncbi:1-phosphofructokinase [uncultured Megasphaera sp.]|uniref:1-phosphofructokinase n=1 Tax=uncultured Megasphaera sp. TaxID=165188 RepID=UPI0026597437|nr:1-phosphofructokinase [uncultured Megasphaera sp.]